jgi:glycosyltransferase involved in cell wall biosynthesis
VVVPNCVDVEPFLRLLPNRARSAGDKVALILGRIHREKGFDLLIPAIARLASKVPELVLSIAGPDENGYAAKVKEMATFFGVEGRVRFEGNLDDDGRLRALEAASIVVAPSYRENFGMAIAEAMAAGVPVLVTDCVNSWPGVKASGAGVIVKPTVDAVTAGIAELLRRSAEWPTMGASGQNFVSENYSPAAVGSRMAAAYRAAINGEPRSEQP